MKERNHEDKTVKKEHTVLFLQFIVCKIISDCFQMQVNNGIYIKYMKAKQIHYIIIQEKLFMFHPSPLALAHLFHSQEL